MAAPVLPTPTAPAVKAGRRVGVAHACLQLATGHRLEGQGEGLTVRLSRRSRQPVATRVMAATPVPYASIPLNHSRAFARRYPPASAAPPSKS